MWRVEIREEEEKNNSYTYTHTHTIHFIFSKKKENVLRFNFLLSTSLRQDCWTNERIYMHSATTTTNTYMYIKKTLFSLYCYSFHLPTLREKKYWFILLVSCGLFWYLILLLSSFSINIYYSLGKNCHIFSCLWFDLFWV